MCEFILSSVLTIFSLFFPSVFLCSNPHYASIYFIFIANKFGFLCVPSAYTFTRVLIRAGHYFCVFVFLRQLFSDIDNEVTALITSSLAPQKTRPKSTPHFTVYPVRPTTPMGDTITTTMQVSLRIKKK